MADELPSTHSPTDADGTSGRPFAGLAAASAIPIALLLLVAVVVVLAVLL